jgi:2-keto-4-pentenoate hydratase/2-oxohepta-3-ene-1,7-dioic acid hydratase in catechol pathway
MKLLTFHTEKGLKLGVSTGQGVLDVVAANAAMDQSAPESIDEVLNREDALSALEKLVVKTNAELFLDEEQLKLGPCVPNPGKIICVGLNYKKHAEETNAPVPEVPILFNKFSNTIAAQGDEVPLPFNSAMVDYEAELVIVIGKKTKRVPKEEALSHVFGYCIVNDVSARDLQMKTQQWLLGKSCDGFSPLGPYLVSADEVGNPNKLSIRAYLNGEIRQDSNTSDMIFYCDEIVSYISQHMTLEPGDIILTGTPEGVILGFPQEKQVWLKDGDIVTIVIEKLGVLTNRFVQEI